MAVLDDLRTAVTNALSAGAGAARAQGTALATDFEKLVKPNLDAIVVEAAAIAQDRIDGNIGDDQARDDLATQFDRVQTEILAAAELSLLAAQVIINAVLDALKAAIDTATTRAIGVALF
jgi:predicted type IV restriction endonuclease